MEFFLWFKRLLLLIRVQATKLNDSSSLVEIFKPSTLFLGKKYVSAFEIRNDANHSINAINDLRWNVSPTYMAIFNLWINSVFSLLVNLLLISYKCLLPVSKHFFLSWTNCCRNCCHFSWDFLKSLMILL